MINRRIFALLFSVFFCPQEAFAWGTQGHNLIGRLVYEELTPDAKSAVDFLILNSGSQATPECPVSSIEQASVWPDCVRNKKIKKYRWTYGLHSDPMSFCKAVKKNQYCPNGRCASAAIDKATRVLSDRGASIAKRLIALEEILHFVGDIHQPMHAVYSKEPGGANILVLLPSKDTPIHLHQAWDGYLYKQALTGSAQVEEVRSLVRQNYQRWQGGTAESWGRDSFSLVSNFAYGALRSGGSCGNPPSSPVRMTSDYISYSSIIIQKQIAKAVIRSSHLINAALN